MPKKRRPPAKTPEAREDQMVSLAVDLAQQQLEDGTATSQVITHFLKIGATASKIEKEILKEQRELIRAKTEALKSAKKVEELYLEALTAMRRYTGNKRGDEDEEE